MSELETHIIFHKRGDLLLQMGLHIVRLNLFFVHMYIHTKKKLFVDKKNEFEAAPAKMFGFAFLDIEKR